MRLVWSDPILGKATQYVMCDLTPFFYTNYGRLFPVRSYQHNELVDNRSVDNGSEAHNSRGQSKNSSNFLL